MRNNFINRCRGYMHYLLLTALSVLLFTNVYAQPAEDGLAYPGVAPVMIPAGGFGVDGDAFSNYPGGIYANSGDWFSSPSYPGTGGTVFNMATPDPFDLIPELTSPVIMAKHFPDPYQDVDPTRFTTSNKINDDPGTYLWGPGPSNSPGKNEINNATVVFTFGNPILGGDPDDLWAVIAGDRAVVQGSSYIDFEFLQNSLVANANGTFTSEGPHGGRTVGDLLVTLVFTGGGNIATVRVNRWVANGPGYIYQEQNPDTLTGMIYSMANGEETEAPWMPFGQGEYLVYQYAEGAVNLSRLFDFDEQSCGYVSTVFVRTRTSGNSSSSELKDIAGPPFQVDIGLADLEMECPEEVYLPSCTTDGEILTAYNEWKDGFTYSSTHNPMTNMDEFPMLPAGIACGDTITFTFEVWDDCTSEPLICTSTFGVAADEEGPEFMNVPAAALYSCLSDVPAAGSLSWTDNCAGSGSALGTDSDLAGDECNGTITRSWTAVDDCGNETTVTQTITILDETGPVITLPSEPLSMECFDADAVAEWAATASAMDACDGDVDVDFDYEAPYSNCDETITVTFTAVDNCGNETEATMDFIVDDETGPVITLPSEPLSMECFDADAVAEWAATASASDACDGDVDVDFDYEAPYSNCDETITVTFTAVDNCGNESEATMDFTVNDETGPVITLPSEPLSMECFDADAVAEWAATASAMDNCDGDVDVDFDYEAPLTNCDQTVTVTFTAVDNCLNESELTMDFTVNDETAPVLESELMDLTFSCAEDVVLPSPEFSDNCGGDVTVECLIAGTDIPCDEYTFTAGDTEICFTAMDECGSVTEECITITIEPCSDQFCTLTQGFYGNRGGLYCDETTTIDLLNSLLTTDLVLGTGSRTFTIHAGNSQCVIDILPGGGPSSILPGIRDCGNMADLLDKKGVLKNALLAQAITLGLNVRLDTDLSALEFASRSFYTMASSDCDDEEAYPVADTEEYYALPLSVWNALGGTPTVAEIMYLANQALGGIATGVPLGDFTSALGVINDALDECRFIFFMQELQSAPVAGKQTVSDVNLVVSPNPFSSETQVSFELPQDSRINLSVFNMQGMKVAELFEGNAEAGKKYTFRYNNEGVSTQSLIVVLRTGFGNYSTRIIKTQ